MAVLGGKAGDAVVEDDVEGREETGRCERNNLRRGHRRLSFLPSLSYRDSVVCVEVRG